MVQDKTPVTAVQESLLMLPRGAPSDFIAMKDAPSGEVIAIGDADWIALWREHRQHLPNYDSDEAEDVLIPLSYPPIRMFGWKCYEFHKVGEQDDRLNVAVETLVVQESGWPVTTMRVRILRSWAGGWDLKPVAGPPRVSWQSGLRICGQLWSTTSAKFDTLALPVMPVWPGFALSWAFGSGIVAVFVYGTHPFRVLRWKAAGRCQSCGYDVQALGQCPECGKSNTKASGRGRSTGIT